MVAADIVDWVRGAVWVEFESIVWAASEIANEPFEGTKVNVSRTDACFCKFADSKEDVCSGVVGKVEKCADRRAERKASVFLFKEFLIFFSCREIGFAEYIVCWERCFSFKVFAVWVIALKSI